MIRILTISMLVTIIYSWDEVLRVVRVLVNGLFRKNIISYYKYRSDQLVGPIVMMAVLPITLAGLLVHSSMSPRTLGVAGTALLIISILAAGSGVFVRRMRAYHNSETNQKNATVVYAVLGLLSPLASPVLIFDALPKKELAKITFWLSMPPFCGLAIAYANRIALAPSALLPHLDALTWLLVVGLIIIIVIKLLEQAFHNFKLNTLFSYLRVILGIILAAMVVNGIV